MNVMHLWNKKLEDATRPRRLVYINQSPTVGDSPQQESQDPQDHGPDVEAAGNLLKRLLTRDPKQKGSITCRGEVKNLVAAVKAATSEPAIQPEKGNGITRRALGKGAIVAGVSSFILALLGPAQHLLAQDADDLETGKLTLEEFEKKLLNYVNEFVLQHKGEVVESALPPEPGHDIEHLSEEEIEEVKKEVHHAMKRERKNFFDDPMAQEGRNFWTLGGDALGAGSFGHAIYLWVNQKQINIGHYIAIAAACGMKMFGATSEKREHLIHEWEVSGISFTAMILMGSLFKGEFFKGVDFSRYTDEQLSFVMMTIAHVVAPMNTTLGASTIMAPVLREFKKRWTKSGMTEEEVDTKIYRQFVHVPNMAGIIGPGDYPFLKVVQEIGPMQLLPWQLEGGIGSKSLLDEWIASAVYMMYQLAPEYTADKTTGERRKTSRAKKMAWAVKQVGSGENWKAFAHFFNHLVPVRAISAVATPVKKLYRKRVGKSAEDLPNTKDLVRQTKEDLGAAIAPFVEDMANLTELSAALGSGDTSELTRCAMTEMIQQNDIYEAFTDTLETEEITEKDIEMFWEAVIRKAVHYDKVERPSLLAETHSLQEIIVAKVQPRVNGKQDGETMRQFLRRCINILEEEVEKTIDPLQKPHQVDSLEGSGMDAMRAGLFKRIFNKKKFWQVFKEKASHHKAERGHIVHYVNTITQGAFKLHPMLERVAAGKSELAPQVEAKVRSLLEQCEQSHAVETQSARARKALEKSFGHDTERLKKLTEEEIAELLGEASITDPTSVAGEIAQESRKGKIKVTGALKKKFLDDHIEEHRVRTIQELCAQAVAGAFPINGDAWKSLIKELSEHGDFEQLNPIEDKIDAMISGELKLDSKTRGEIAEYFRDNQNSVAASTMAEALTNLAVPRDIPGNAGASYLKVLLSSVGYFMNPHYAAHRLAPFFGPTIAEMLAVLPKQIASIVPVVDMLTRAEVYIDIFAEKLGKTRAIMLYCSFIAWAVSGTAENYTGFSIGAESLKQLLGPMLGKHPYSVKVDDPDLKPFFSALYAISIMGGYSNLLGDYGPHMAFLNQITEKGKFPDIGKSFWANGRNSAAGLAYVWLTQVETSIPAFNRKVEEYQGKKLDEGEHGVDADAAGIDEDVLDAMVKHMLENLKKKYAGEELPEEAKKLVDQMELFVKDKDAALHQHFEQHAPNMDPEKMTEEHQFKREEAHEEDPAGH